MRRTSLLVVLAVASAVAAFTVGCTVRPEVTPGAPPPTPVVRVGSTADGQGATTPVEELASRFPLAAPAGKTDDMTLDDTECIACHTDQEAVQALAVEPEEEEELSEGEG